MVAPVALEATRTVPPLHRIARNIFYVELFIHHSFSRERLQIRNIIGLYDLQQKSFHLPQIA